MNKKYSREDKIIYYRNIENYLKSELKRIDNKIWYLQSDNYQDWDSSLQKDLDRRTKDVAE